MAFCMLFSCDLNMIIQLTNETATQTVAIIHHSNEKLEAAHHKFQGRALGIYNGKTMLGMKQRRHDCKKENLIMVRSSYENE